MQKAILLSLAILTVSLSGCAGGENAETGTLTRLISIEASEAELDQIQDPADIVQTSYVYTHESDAVDVSDVTVEIHGENGVLSKPLSKYTTKSQLQNGDTVTIDNLPALAGVRLENGNTMASRTGIDASWLLAEGTPLPIANEGNAKWEWTATAGTSSGFSYWETEETYEESDGNVTETTIVEDASAAMQVELDGTMALDITGEEAILQLDQTFQTTASAQADLTLHYESEDGESYEETMSPGADASITANTEATLTFEKEANVLTSAKADFSMTASGYADYWIQEDDKQSADLGLPIRESYSEPKETLEALQQVEEELNFLLQLYAAGIQIGDQMNIDIDFDGFILDYDFSALREDTRTTDAGDLETIVLHMEIASKYAFFTLFEYAFDIHVEKESFLPAYAATSTTFDVPASLMQLGFEAAELNVELPEQLQAQFSFDTTFALTELEGDLQTSPFLFFIAPLSIGFMTAAFAEGFMEEF